VSRVMLILRLMVRIGSIDESNLFIVLYWFFFFGGELFCCVIEREREKKRRSQVERRALPQ